MENRGSSWFVAVAVAAATIVIGIGFGIARIRQGLDVGMHAGSQVWPRLLLSEGTVAAVRGILNSIRL